jgi:hypothetical protein|nr:MAG TPA: hypothetical protein [Caudoviricetes sp.]DAY14229.1 MAG TPA: hypothetical protein [Caudoviricetes sp.]
MNRFKATSNVVFNINGYERAFDKDAEYNMDKDVVAELNAKGAITHPELSPFFVPVEIEEEIEADD